MKLLGCGTALVTPFNKDFSVDFSAYSCLVKRQVEAGVDFLVALGTTAEASCLTLEEKESLVELTLQECKNIPVLVGVGANCTSHVLESLRIFNRTAILGYLITVPYYNKPNQNGLLNHYRLISQATEKQIILYNIPGRTGVNMSAGTVLELAKLPNIVGIKEASSHYEQISEIIVESPSDFSVFSGNDEDTLPLMSLGARGVISAVANLIPKQMKKLTTLLLKGEMFKARELHYRLRKIFINCFKDTNPQPIKGAMAKLGLMKNVFRLPLCPTREELVNSIIEELELID